MLRGMAELVPMPISGLIDRVSRELRDKDAVFDLPVDKGFLGSPAHDFSVSFHGRRASSPLGPAAGPHSQMAQNIALAWLGGCRIIELKTVQIMDELEIPRPCIDMRTVGYNVEWSQELKLEQSAEEYVKGVMLVEVLKSRLHDRLAPGFTDTIFDMSVGYDLEGIRSAPVRRFIDTMLDCRSLAARLRDEIPREFGEVRDLPIPEQISSTLTLSTFHGCPPDEIERILEFLMREYGLDVIVKLNPTLLGPDGVDHLLHDVMGYRNVSVPRDAFEKDTTWDQACAFTERLRALAEELDVGFGAKFTNTLIVTHDGDYLPGSEAQKYLSGAPLHVLAMNLVARFRDRFGPDLPISFSAGIDRHNFADAVAMGLCPVTVCSDLLQTGGYARLSTYYRNLMQQMDDAGVSSLDDWVCARAGTTEMAEARIINTRRHVAEITEDPRYRYDQNHTPPKKVGTTLELFNCLTCDKCIPVCPNNANFALPIDKGSEPTARFNREGGRWVLVAEETIELTKKHQIANLADFCNECGNCDVFCPEDGGPYIEKPRFFGTLSEYEAWTSHDGFFVEEVEGAVHVCARIEGAAFTAHIDGRQVRYAGDGFDVSFSLDDPAATITGDAPEGTEVNLEPAVIMDLMQRAIRDDSRINPVNVARS